MPGVAAGRVLAQIRLYTNQYIFYVVPCWRPAILSSLANTSGYDQMHGERAQFQTSTIIYMLGANLDCSAQTREIL
eukprot:5622030-Pleurochrysis_carterae.AAC.2